MALVEVLHVESRKRNARKRITYLTNSVLVVLKISSICSYPAHRKLTHIAWGILWVHIHHPHTSSSGSCQICIARKSKPFLAYRLGEGDIDVSVFDSFLDPKKVLIDLALVNAGTTSALNSRFHLTPST